MVPAESVTKEVGSVDDLILEIINLFTKAGW